MIYIMVFMSSIFFAWLAERSKDKGVIILCSVISILIPSILGGLRAHGVGTDTMVYGLSHAMQALSSPNLAHFMTHSGSEPGYKILCYFTMKTFGHVNWCYFFYQLITISCFYIGAYKHKKYCSLPFIMLIFYFLRYNSTYNLIRQSIALSIIFMGLDTLESKQYFKFIIYVSVATLFHYSSVIAVILLLGIHFIMTSDFIAKSNYTHTVILYGAILLLMSARPLMSIISSLIPFMTKYVRYLGGGFDMESKFRPLSVIAFSEILMLMFYSKGVRQAFSKLGNDNFDFFRVNVVIIICVTYSITLRFITDRLLLYSHYANIIMLSLMPKFVKEKHLKLLVSILVIAMVALFWWGNYIFKRNGATWPYRSILD